MTLAAQRILIIGGGFSGMSAAIELRKLGADVDLVEIAASWREDGTGISLGGATLRALKQLGVLDAFLAHGAAGDGISIRLPHGPQIAELPTLRLAGPEVPGGGAILRPALARILADATRASGARVILGHTFRSITQDAEGVDLTFTDGQRRRYDLVIGADGLYSHTRQIVFPGAPRPRYMGQACWRAVAPRPHEIRTTTIWIGAKVKPGVNPVSQTTMYLFITEPRSTNDHVDRTTFVDQVRALLADFAAPELQAIRDGLGPASEIVFRPLEGMLMPRPWFHGRVVLIGDAVHATTPHLAAGACIGIEDAIVLADEIGRQSRIEIALAAFEQRRWERCRMVVENSRRLGEIEIAGGDNEEHARITRESHLALAQPI